MKQNKAERSAFGAFGATVLALCLLVAWTRELDPWWLAAALAACLAATLLLASWRRARPGSPPGALPASVALLLLGAGIAVFLTWQFDRLATDWSEIVAEREAELGTELNARMTDAASRGRSAAEQAARIAGSRARGADMFQPLAALLNRHDIDAIALYTDAGSPIAWAGDHRGALPADIWDSDRPAHFEERPLFSYLYFPVAVPGRREHAIAAVLVETGVLGDAAEGGISGIVEARTRTRASFRSGGGGEDAVWSLVTGSDTVVHARLEPLSQREWRSALELVGRRAVLLAMLAAYIALAVAWLSFTGPGRRPSAAAMPLVLLLAVAAVAPLRDVFADEQLFSPVLFALPVRDLTLGRLLALLLPITALIASMRYRRRPSGRLWVYIAVGAVAIAVLYPIALYVLFDATTSALREGPPTYWYGFQLTLALALSGIALLLLPRVDDDDTGRVRIEPSGRRSLIAGALALSTAFALACAFIGAPDQPPSFAVAALWAVPFAMGAAALAARAGRAGNLWRLLFAGWIAGTAVLPHLWRHHVDARLTAAELELERLGARADPFLHYLLEEFGNEALARFDAGESGVQLAYRAWVSSGLAQQAYPSRVVLWASAGVPEVQFGTAPLPQIVTTGEIDAILASAHRQSTPAILEFTDVPDLSRLLTVPLADGSLITVMVPPRRTLDRTSTIAPFLGVATSPSTQLNLVAATGEIPEQVFVGWQENPNGWRSEAFVRYPDNWYHAHLAVNFAPVGVRLARGMLIIAFDLALLVLLWIVGVVARGGSAIPRGEWRAWFGTVRMRTTLALFGFFLVPTAVFGWVAYTALAGEVERVAQTWAQHSVALAVHEFNEGTTDLRDLASHAGADVLRYMNGELIDVSSREALDLGVYGAWMPSAAFVRLRSGEDQAALAHQNLGDQPYVTAFHDLRPSGTLGIPMFLALGDIAVRQRQFAHLVLFAVIIGALLSLALSFVVGRALAEPIDQLRRASAAVGSGRFVRLPKQEGEFGQLFDSFNRMARRLRRARAREVQTARVLAWGEMARQVAHEIKNPLTPIKLAVQHLRRARADDHPQFDEILDDNVSQILIEIDRLSEIARAFSRYGAPAVASGPVTHVDAQTVIREALTLYRSGDRAVRYVDDVDAGLPPVFARADELKEVLLNLVENARSALDGNGRIDISAYRIDGEFAAIDVADNGPGMPPEVLARVFEPHFSTRSSGTGLGLAIVRRLVESWGGSVAAEVGADRGTVVRIRVRTERSRSEESAGEPAGPGSG